MVRGYIAGVQNGKLGLKFTKCGGSG